MSCYEWSRGTIKLPSAEFAKFRQAIQAAEQKKVQATFDASQKFWAGLSAKQKRSAEEYMKAVRALRTEDWNLTWVLERHCKDGKPTRVLKSEMEWPTNRTTAFHDDDLSITFNAKEHTVTYDVGENNHAREHAAQTPIGRAFDEHIAKVRWAHGTGGVILGNDEYSREAGYDEPGGGGSYVVAAYGYLGIKEAPTNVGTFINTKGQRIKAEVKVTKWGFVGKPVVDTRPQYSGYGYGRSGYSRW